MDCSTVRRLELRACRLATLCGLLLLPALVQAQSRAGEPSTETAQLWSQGVDHIVRGQFSEARESLSRIMQSQPGDESYMQVASWLDHRDEFDTVRSSLHAEQRQAYLTRAKKSYDEGKLSDALDWARGALESGDKQAAFMREPWMQELHDKAVQQARKHKEKEEWTDAASLYYGLRNLYEGNPEYQRELDQCVAHSRLEAIYNADAKWKSRLRGITPRIVDDVLWQIHSKYVVDCDFKDVAVRAVSRLRLLADSSSIAELFPAVKEEDKHTQYVRRLAQLTTKIERQKMVSYSYLQNDIFDKVLKINRQTLNLPREMIIYEFLEGALGDEDSLDTFTSVIWPADYAEFEKHTQGHFSGVGIQIALEDNQLTVVSPLEDTPAFRANVQAGDKITHVDGESTEGLSLTGAVQTITGPVGTAVVLTIHRPRTKETFDLSLNREDIEIQSVKGHRRQAESEKWDYLIDREFGIGYIRVGNFADNTAASLRHALSEMERDGARAFILDLRFNPGGLLRSAIEVTEIFLPQDDLIVRTQGQHSEPFSRGSRSRNRHNKLPMVVLINEHSASASEIVAGALKDHGRAVIVGERSFGKGSVQNLIPVGHTNAHLKLTTAYYYLPGGQCIHKQPDSDLWGVEPDIAVKLVPRETIKILSMRRDADVIRLFEESGDVADGADRAQEPVDPAVESKPMPVVPGEPEGGTAAPSAGSEGAADAAANDANDAKDAKEAVDDLEDILIEYPDVDYQLETALLVLRVQLLKRLGFEILPKVKLGANPAPVHPAIATN